MRKFVKKSILNGLVRALVSFISTILISLKSNIIINNEDDQIKVIDSFNKNEPNKEHLININNNDLNRNVYTKIDNNTNDKNDSHLFFRNELKHKSDDYETDDDYSSITSSASSSQSMSLSPSTKLLHKKYESFTPSTLPQTPLLHPHSSKIKYKQYSLSFNKQDKNCFSKLLVKFCQFRGVFLLVTLIIGYICLNNYLIIYVYYQPSITSSSSLLPESMKSFNGTYYSDNDQSNDTLFISYFSSQLNQNDVESGNTFKKRNDDHFQSLIDPLDIEVMRPQFKIDDKLRRIILNESYFDQFDDVSSNIKKTDRLDDTNQCVHPKLDPYDPEIMQFVKKEFKLKCNPKENWIYVENGTLRVSKSAVLKHGNILCAYIPLYRGNNDFTVYEGNRIFPVMDRMPLITDFFKIGKLIRIISLIP
jgi:hypothetical protein